MTRFIFAARAEPEGWTAVIAPAQRRPISLAKLGAAINPEGSRGSLVAFGTGAGTRARKGRGAGEPALRAWRCASTTARKAAPPRRVVGFIVLLAPKR